MQIDELLAKITETTRMLMTQRLRSKAAVLAELSPLTEEASRRGVAYQTIHQAMTAGGFEITFGYYETARLRVRARTLRPGQSDTADLNHEGSHQPPPSPNNTGSQEPKQDQSRVGSQEPEPLSQREEVEPRSDSGLPDAQKSLKKADALVAETDFAAIARQLRRKQAK